MPVSSSIMTQASMGSAISLPLLFRCSSSPVPNAGFSVHESENRGSNKTEGSRGSQDRRGARFDRQLRGHKTSVVWGLKKKKGSMVEFSVIRSAADLDGRFLGQQPSLGPSSDIPLSNWCQITIMCSGSTVFPYCDDRMSHTRATTFQQNLSFGHHCNVVLPNWGLWCERVSLCANKRANRRMRMRKSSHKPRWVWYEKGWGCVWRPWVIATCWETRLVWFRPHVFRWGEGQ